MLPIDTLKSLLGITDDTQDAVLRFVLAGVEESINNYCNTSEVHPGLYNTAYRMAVDAYRAEGYGQPDAPAGEVASISEGDVSVSFRDGGASKSYQVYVAGILKNYTAQLNRYRKVRPICPCYP